jgi:hypothetical protein
MRQTLVRSRRAARKSCLATAPLVLRVRRRSVRWLCATPSAPSALLSMTDVCYWVQQSQSFDPANRSSSSYYCTMAAFPAPLERIMQSDLACPNSFPFSNVSPVLFARPDAHISFALLMSTSLLSALDGPLCPGLQCRHQSATTFRSKAAHIPGYLSASRHFCCFLYPFRPCFHSLFCACYTKVRLEPT